MKGAPRLARSANPAAKGNLHLCAGPRSLDEVQRSGLTAKPAQRYAVPTSAGLRVGCGRCRGSRRSVSFLTTA